MKISELLGKNLLLSISEGGGFSSTVISSLYYQIFNEIQVVVKNKENGKCYVFNIPYSHILAQPQADINGLLYLDTKELQIGVYLTTCQKESLNLIRNYDKLPFYGKLKGIEFSKEDFADYFAQKEAEEKEREQALWFRSKIDGFSVDFYKPLSEMQEELKSYYLAAVKDIIEKDKNLISNDTIKDAIKNGLVVKYPELKLILTKEESKIEKGQNVEFNINNIFYYGKVLSVDNENKKAKIEYDFSGETIKKDIDISKLKII